MTRMARFYDYLSSNEHTHTRIQTYTQTCTHIHTHSPLWRINQCECHRMTKMTGSDCVVISICAIYSGVINTHTHTHTQRGETKGTRGLSKSCTSRESVSPLSRLIRGFRSKYHRFPFGRINASGIEWLGWQGWVVRLCAIY